MVAVLLGAIPANANESPGATPGWRASAGLAGHGVVASIAEQAHYGWAGTLSIGAEKAEGTPRPHYLGGALTFVISETPMGRRVLAITPGFEAVLRYDRVRLTVEPVVGWLTIERSTHGDPQWSFIFGAAVSLGYDVVRWDGGAIHVQGRGQLAYGLPLAGLGVGLRF